MRKVRDIMSAAPVCMAPGESVSAAARAMKQHGIGTVLVLTDGRLTGLVTDRDIKLNLPSQATSLSVWELNHLLTRLTVGKVMTQSVITVGPDREARDAAQLMLDHTIGALPVVDGGRLVGIVTETDLLRAFVKSADKTAALRSS